LFDVTLSSSRGIENVIVFHEGDHVKNKLFICIFRQNSGCKCFHELICSAKRIVHYGGVLFFLQRMFLQIADHLSVFIEHTQIKNLKFFSQYVALSEEQQIQARSELLHLFKEKEFVCLYVLRDLNNPDKLRWGLENDVRKILFVEDRVVDHLLDECEGDHVCTNLQDHPKW
jgi:hypothetical protein